MSVGYGEGELCLRKAILDALYSPLLSDNNVVKAKKVLFIVYSSKEYPLLIEELDVLDDFMKEFDQDVELIWGQYEDDTLGDKAKFAIIATGVEDMMSGNRQEMEQVDEYIRRLYEPRMSLSSKEPEKDLPDKKDDVGKSENTFLEEKATLKHASVADKLRKKWSRNFEKLTDWVYNDDK